MAAVDRFSSFARSLSSIHLQQENMLSEGRGNTLRRRNNRLPRSKSPTSTVMIGDMPPLPFPATDSCPLHASSTTAMERLSKGERRRATVTFAPLPTSSDVATFRDTKLKRRRRRRATIAFTPTPTVSFRRDYDLGETLRSRFDMNSQPTSDENMDSLQKHDFAFIKRSDGSYTYSILAGRDEEGESMTFVLDNNGSTKVIRKRNWKKLVCLVSA